MVSNIRIADIGAANGFDSSGWGGVSLIGFEPDSRSYISLVSSGKFEKVFPCALGSSSETRALYLTRKKEVSSFLQPNRAYVDLFPDASRWDIISQEEIEVRPLDLFQDEIGEIDFIKLDTQGTELDILLGSINSLKSVLAVQIEVEFIEIYEGQPLFSDILSFMNQNGFQFYDFTTEYRYGRQELNRKGQLAFADALFMRTPEYVLETYKINDAKLAKYMKIVEVFGKNDLKVVVEENFRAQDGN